MSFEKRFWRENVRTGEIIYIAGSIACGECDERFDAYLAEASFDDIESWAGEIPESIRVYMEDGDFLQFYEFIFGNKDKFLVQVITPIRGESWSFVYKKFFYGDTVEEAIECGFEWVKQVREREQKKSSIGNRKS